MTGLAITQMDIPPGFIDLSMGNPDIDLLPLDLLRQSAESHFAAGDRRSLQYGYEQGDGNFRCTLADFLTRAYGTRVDPGLLFVTAGASSAIDLLCTLYTRPGDVHFNPEGYALLGHQVADSIAGVLPEPASAVLLVLGGMVIVRRGRKR